MTLELGGSEQGHQNRLGLSAFVGPILLRDLSGEDGRSHLLLCMIIIRAHPFILQKGEEFPLMPPQSFEESFGISILIRAGYELVQPTIQSPFQAMVCLGTQLVAFLR